MPYIGLHMEYLSLYAVSVRSSNTSTCAFYIVHYIVYSVHYQILLYNRKAAHYTGDKYLTHIVSRIVRNTVYLLLICVYTIHIYDIRYVVYIVQCTLYPMINTFVFHVLSLGKS